MFDRTQWQPITSCAAQSPRPEGVAVARHAYKPARGVCSHLTVTSVRRAARCGAQKSETRMRDAEVTILQNLFFDVKTFDMRRSQIAFF